MPPVWVRAFIPAAIVMMASSSGDITNKCGTGFVLEPCKHHMTDNDWYQFGADRCVKVFFKTQHLDWGDAEEACQECEYYNYNGHLVSIHSEEEWTAAICIMYKVHPGKPTYWIGLTRDPYFFHYKWSDYSEFNFGRLVGEEPDELWGSEYCVEMNYGHWGHWNRNKCSDRKPYMCQVQF